MTNSFLDKEQVRDLIKDGKELILAGDEKVLSQLPSGDWIGGTIPYFMTSNGGFFSQDRIYVTQVPDFVVSGKIATYSNDTIHNIYSNAPDHGLSIVIIPASCSTHLTFALNSPNFKDFASKPLIGWVSGIFLDDLGKITPKVFNGNTMEAIENGAVVYNIELPKNKIAEIQIINLFTQGSGDTFTFPEAGFSAKEAFVNGEKVSFAEYLVKNKIDIQLPLVADVYGEMINTSFQTVDAEKGLVSFYAPVFTGVRYKIATPVGDYVERFKKAIPEGVSDEKIYFTCNCILNYLYAKLEGRKTANFTGPITFGEIAYQLLNQTFAFVSIEDI